MPYKYKSLSIVLNLNNDIERDTKLMLQSKCDKENIFKDCCLEAINIL